MPTYLKESNPMDRYKCDCCGKITPKALIHEHHAVKRASGGSDALENIFRLDSGCHTAVHQIEAALKRGSGASELVQAIFPDNPVAQRKCLELAATAAMGLADKPLDYSQWDTEELVYLSPPQVTPHIRKLVNRVVQEMKNPKTGRKMGVAGYLRMLVEMDLKRRGLPLTNCDVLPSLKGGASLNSIK